MGFLDWIGGAVSKVGEAINQKIASFERATGVDIPFVGADLKKEAQKPVQSQQPQQTTQQQLQQAREYFQTGKTSSPFQPTTQQPQQTSQAQEPKTYRVTLGSVAHERQIKEIEEQVGTKVKLVPTEKGEIAVEFTTPKEIKEVKVTPYEQIIKEQEEARKREIAEQIYQKASPLEKVGLHLHTAFSGRGFEYLAGLATGKAENIVKEQIVKAMEVPKGEELKYAGQTAIESLWGTPTGVLGVSMLIGAGAGAVAGKLAPTIASKVPVLAKVGQAIAEHPTATKVIVGAVATGVEAMKVKQMAEQKMPIEKIAGEVSRDITAMAGFGYGFKYGMEKTLPKQQMEIIGRRTEEKTLKLVAGREEGIPEGKIAVSSTKTEKFIEPTPAKEWMEAVKKGKIVKETPEYVIKEYKGYEYLISKEPTGLPTKKLEGELIETLRGEKLVYLKLGVTKEGKYKGMEVFVRKGVGIPIERSLPPEEEFKPTVFKPSKEPRPILSELAEYYKAQKEAEVAKKIAETQSQQSRAIEEATKEMLGLKAVEKTTKEVATKSGSLLLEAPRETGFVPLEPTVSPVALSVEVSPTVSSISPAIIFPSLIPRAEKTFIKQVEKQELKAEPFSKPKTKLEIEPITKPKPKEEITPIEITPRKEKITPIITTIQTPKQTIEPIPELKIEPKPIELTPPIKTTTPFHPFTPLPILFPELPKGSLGRMVIEDRKMFKQITKYEPSLLGILLGKKRGKREPELFTGFEIRGM